MCCNSWGRKLLDTTEQLTQTERLFLEVLYKPLLSSSQICEQDSFTSQRCGLPGGKSWEPYTRSSLAVTSGVAPAQGSSGSSRSLAKHGSGTCL